ncbi:hypothetical protein OSTOST_08353 [Ostertagia ostertagi]
MLFAVAALPSLLVNCNSVSFQECNLGPPVREVYEQFLLKANPGLIWNDAMSSQALRELERPGSVLRPGAPYIHFGAERFVCVMARSVFHKIHGLGEGVNYGCNGVYTTENSQDMKVLCLFQNY